MMLLTMLGALLTTGQASLPAPDGPYAVGVQRFELVDDSRKGVAEDAANQPRALPAIIWYPARKSNAPTAPYFTGSEADVQIPALVRNFQFDATEIGGVSTIRTHSFAGMPAFRGSTRFPIVIFSHGYFLYANQNQPLAETLASHGYIVVAIDHPRDSVDVKTGDGRVVATNQDSEKNKVLFEVSGMLFSGKTHDERVSVLGRYAKVFPASRMAISLAAWRDDTLFTVRSLRSGRVPAAVRAILATADKNRVALAGMSFGGATSATTCRMIVQCRAIINLDGANFDPALFDGKVERPMLLIQSDWTKHSIVPGQPRDPGFTPNDYAFERWSQLGTSGQVLRVRIEDITHMGLTDLGLFMSGPKLSERLGAAEPAHVTDIIDRLSLAFLDVHLKQGKKTALDGIVARTPGLVLHNPEQTRRWALSRARK